MTLSTTFRRLIPILVLLVTLSALFPPRTTASSDPSPSSGTPSAPSAVFTGTGTGAIPDGGPGPANWGAPLNVNFPVVGLNGKIRHMVLSVTMTHTFIGDLDAVLIGPGGQVSHVIFSRVGATTPTGFGDASNLGGTYTFADFATANPWSVATNQMCGDNCIITPQYYRTTVAGPAGIPAGVTTFRSGFFLFSENGIWTLRFRDGAQGDTGFVTAASLTIETLFTPAGRFDFDGDDKTDIGIFRPGSGEWWINRSTNGSTFALQFGAATDRLVPADFTGDGKTDIAVWRPSSGQWFVLRSEDFSFYAFPYGTSGDIPAPADYEDDGRANAAVFRPSNGTWYILGPSGGTTTHHFGAPGDVPVVGDYDRDGLADPAIFRPSVSEWWINGSSSDVFAVQFGAPGDKAVPGDYTRDGRTDIAVWRPSNGTWYVLRSENMTYYSVPFGTSGDIPAPGDYDGDGMQDPTVFRPSTATWYSNRAKGGILIQRFGVNGDTPVANAYVP